MLGPQDVAAAHAALGAQLAACCAVAGLIQKALAIKINYHCSSVANVETGRQNVPREFWVACDKALGTGRTLTDGYERLQSLIRQQRAEAMLATRPNQLVSREPGDSEFPSGDASADTAANQAVAAARQLAGWTAFDAGWHSDALRHWLSAEWAAVAAGDVRMAARVRYCQAKQFQHLRHNRDAIDTLRLARDHLGSSATAAITAMLDGAEAASHAALGDAQQAQTLLDRASRAFDQIDPEREPNWMGFFDRGELLAQYGRVYRDMARADRRHGSDAVRWVSEAVRAFGPQNVRSTVLNEVALCSALLLAGEPEQAVAVGTRVIDRARRLSSTRVYDRLHNLRRDLASLTDRGDVREFSHALANVAPAVQ